MMQKQAKAESKQKKQLKKMMQKQGSKSINAKVSTPTVKASWKLRGCQQLSRLIFPVCGAAK